MHFIKVLILALACTCLLFAQVTPAPKAAVAKPVKKEQLSTVKGTVMSVDAIANTIVIKVDKKTVDTVVVDTAKIIVGKDTLLVGNIKADSKIKVICKTVDGKKVATKVSVEAPKVEKAKKAEVIPVKK